MGANREPGIADTLARLNGFSSGVNGGCVPPILSVFLSLSLFFRTTHELVIKTYLELTRPEILHVYTRPRAGRLCVSVSSCDLFHGRAEQWPSRI